MAWESSNRRERLPANWHKLRGRVIRRAGGRCQAVLMDTGQRCGETGRDVDHITPGDNHSLNNLQLLCRWHHTRKTQAEAAQAQGPRLRTKIDRSDREAPPSPW